MELYDQLLTVKDKIIRDEIVARKIYDFMDKSRITYNLYGPIRIHIYWVKQTPMLWLSNLYLCIITNYKKIVIMEMGESNPRWATGFHVRSCAYDCNEIDVNEIIEWFANNEYNLDLFHIKNDQIQGIYVPTFAELLPNTTKSARSIN